MKMAAHKVRDAVWITGASGLLERFFSAYTVQWGHADLAPRPHMIHSSRDSTLVACGRISTPITSE